MGTIQNVEITERRLLRKTLIFSQGGESTVTLTVIYISC